MNFWNKNDEVTFFERALKKFAPPEKLFYELPEGYFAYIPKKQSAEGKVVQARNALIGSYTEKWCKDFFQPIADQLKLFPVNGVVCQELGLNNTTDADLAFCTTKSKEQSAENIKLIFEVKMGIVNNYSYNDKSDKLKFEGDYKTHKGNPSILRSDSMLKAIGKSINIRVSGAKSAKIPIVILGNSPIAESYIKKVDFLKQAGVVQGFISLYPNPTAQYIQKTPNKGFQTFNDYSALKSHISELIQADMNFFSSMLPKQKLGEMITISAKEETELAKAERFLQLLDEES